MLTSKEQANKQTDGSKTETTYFSGYSRELVNFNEYIVTDIVVKTLIQLIKYDAYIINDISLYITVLLQIPNKPKCHAAMAASICVVCFRKPKTLRPISESVNGMIKSLILPQF